MNTSSYSNISNGSPYFIGSLHRSTKLSTDDVDIHNRLASASSRSATSVITAFRELQAKARSIETERSQVLQERDELREKLSQVRRMDILSKGRIDMITVEQSNSLKFTYERTKRDYSELSDRLAAQEDINHSINRGLMAQRALHTTLNEEVSGLKAKTFSLERKLTLLKNELTSIESRTDRTNDVVVMIYSPERNEKDYARLHDSIADMEERILDHQRLKSETQSKISSLEKYIRLIIKINEELCNTIDMRDQSGKKITDLYDVFKSSPPRHQWPRDVPYSNILNIVNEAAAVTAASTIESAAKNSSAEVVHTILNELSPKREKNGSVSFMDHVSKISPSSSSPSSPKRSSYDKSYADLNKSLRELISQSKSSLHLSKSEGRSSHARYNTWQQTPVDQSDYSSRHNYDDSNVEDEGEFEEDLDEGMRHGILESNDNTQRQKFPNPTKIKKRMSKKSSKTFLSSKDDNFRRWKTLMTRKQRKQAELERNIQQSAMASATRFAAAASAAASIINNRRYQSRSRSTSRSRSQSPYSASYSRVNEVVAPTTLFIPTGRQSQEFNIIANVSKASRAAKELSATIASKVKSLHSAGSGDIFDGIRDLELNDLQNDLEIVKKIRGKSG